jgi:hypothetical protein
MSTSSEEEASTATAPRLYRLQNLELASVFIHRMSIAQAPADVRSLADVLTHTHFRGVLDCSEVCPGRHVMIIGSRCPSAHSLLHPSYPQAKTLLQVDDLQSSKAPCMAGIVRAEGEKAPEGSSAALSAALRLRGGAAGCYGKTKSHWLDFAQDMLTDLRYSDLLQYS